MEFEDAQMEFIQSWGSIGSAWGIPRSMAQIHALLLSSNKELSTEDIMGTIQLSRGNVNTNVRELINWRLISKKSIIGERKEFFQAETDVWALAKNIVEERKRRELKPVLELLRRLKTEKYNGNKEEISHFKSLVSDLEDLISQLDQLSATLIKLNDNKLFKKMIKFLPKPG